MAGEIWRPGSAAEVQAMLAEANASRTKVVLRGGGTKADAGAAPAVILDLTALSALESYEPGELVLRAGAGARVAEIEALLAEHDQMLAFEPPDLGAVLGRASGVSTLGGMIGAGLSGPRRIAAGAVRDHVLGFDAVSGRGEAFKAGGPVVKNVTGYDLPKLVTGAWGALAALTSVTLKVLPKPRTELTMVVAGLEPQSACQAMSRAMGGPWSVSGAVHLPAAVAVGAPGTFAASATALRVDGFSPSVQARAASLRPAMAAFGGVEILGADASRTLWRWVRDLGPFQGGEGALWRLSAPPADGWRLAEPLAASGGTWFLDWAGGQAWWQPADGSPAAALAAVGEIGGHAMGLRGDAAGAAGAATASGPLRALARRVKTAFDPNGVLVPGRPSMFEVAG